MSFFTKKDLITLSTKTLARFGIVIKHKSNLIKATNQIVAIIIENKLSAYQATMLLAELTDFIGRDLSKNYNETTLELIDRTKKDGILMKVGEHLIVMAEDLRSLAYAYRN